ncbi:MAG: hypothetical protein ACREES_04310 [Stellaceae bacterium]
MSDTHHSTNHLHPLIYRIMIGLGVVLILGIYGFAGGHQAYNGLVLVAASLFVVVAIGIPLLLSRIWWRHHAGDNPPEGFREWLHDEFETWQGRLNGADASAEILLPITAVSVGMVIFAIVLFLVAPAGSH